MPVILIVWLLLLTLMSLFINIFSEVVATNIVATDVGGTAIFIVVDIFTFNVLGCFCSF